ncbi:zinc finger protein 84-like [Mya arenaria]|uniref:zinc finger protein 84-like n=1 Tax=Mya arenaria TaxID=6604 RepID=UPI0022E1CDA2|nr:zinc finger protein 84-like [Mya arenaria]XP_052763574.1 zinc finger protein 84-like [Mya arenaria]XP_052763584.1 zinc finger protein 84-like [Mya arenaria]
MEEEELDEMEADGRDEVNELLDTLKSICNELEQHGVDILVFCSGLDNFLASANGEKFALNLQLAHNAFKVFCNDEMSQVLINDGTVQNTDQKMGLVEIPTDLKQERPDIAQFAFETMDENPVNEEGNTDTGKELEKGSKVGSKARRAQVVSVRPVTAGKKQLKISEKSSKGTYVIVGGEEWDFIPLSDVNDSKFECTFCNKEFSSLRYVRFHLSKSHHAKMGYRCECKMFFNTKESFTKHIDREDLEGQSCHLRCTECVEVFSSAEVLKKHISETHSSYHLDCIDAKSDRDWSAEVSKETTEHSCSKCGVLFNHQYFLILHEHYLPDCVSVQDVLETDLDQKEIKYTDAKGETVVVKYGDLLNSQNEPPFVCEICNYKTKRKHGLKRHLLSHVGKHTHTCHVCGKLLKGKDNYDRHMRVHSEKPYMCLKCPAKFISEWGLEQHDLTCKKEYPCELCPFVGVSASALQLHVNRHTGLKQFTCHDCSKSFVSKGSLDRHVAAVHSDIRPFQCHKCEKAFKVKDNLTKHLKVHEDPKYRCEVCGKTCTENGNLKKHMRTHTKEKPFVCEVCGKKYGRKVLLDNHCRIHTGEKPYTCTIEGCDKTFRCYSNLQQHIKTHVPGNPYICDICGRGFKQKGRLNHHRKGHTIEYRWQCQFCEERFKSLFPYKNHLARNHPDKKEEIEESTHIKLFQCTLCQKMFGDKEDLIRHTYIHNNEKPFNCQYCSKRFNDKSNMRQHEKTHCGKRDHFCQQCNKTFYQKRELNSHILKYHTFGSETKRKGRKKESEDQKTSLDVAEYIAVADSTDLQVGQYFATKPTTVFIQGVLPDVEDNIHTVEDQMMDENETEPTGNLDDIVVDTSTLYQPHVSIYQPESSTFQTSSSSFQPARISFHVASSGFAPQSATPVQSIPVAVSQGETMTVEQFALMNGIDPNTFQLPLSSDLSASAPLAHHIIHVPIGDMQHQT